MAWVINIRISRKYQDNDILKTIMILVVSTIMSIIISTASIFLMPR